MIPRAAKKRPEGPPPRIPDFDILNWIGSGSYGDVWLARTTAGSLRAIKVVYRARFTDDRPYEREFQGLKHFERITLRDRTQLALLHLSRDDSRGLFYYVMELADDLNTGVEIHPAQYIPATLENILNRASHLPSDQVMRIGCDLARGLGSLHLHGLVHRDVKPANVILVGGQAKLADLGLLTLHDAGSTYVGTEGYIPPEGPGSPGADIYALGLVLYEAATGKSRHDFPRLPAGFAQRPDLKAFLELNVVLIKACQRDASQRYATAPAMLDDLLRAAALSLRSIQRREVRLRQSRRALALLVALAAIISVKLGYDRVEQENQVRRLAAGMAATGFRAADSGDHLGALPWLVAAAKALGTQTRGNNPYVDQIAVALEKSPSLRIVHHYGGGIDDLHFHSDSQMVAVVAESGELDLWDSMTGKLRKSVTPFKSEKAQGGLYPQSVRFSRDGSLLAVGSNQGDFILTPSDDPGSVLVQHKFPGEITSVAFSPNDGMLAVASSNILFLASYTDGQFRVLPSPLVKRLQTVVFSPDGGHLACSCNEEGLEVFSREDQFTHSHHLQHRGTSQAAVFSPLTPHLFGCFSDGEVVEWDMKTYQPFRRFEHGRAVNTLSLSQDGEQLMTACRDGYVYLRGVSTDESHPLRLPHLPVAPMGCQSPDRRFVAAGSDDGKFALWDLREPALAATRPQEPTEFIHDTAWRSSEVKEVLSRLGTVPDKDENPSKPTRTLLSLDSGPNGAVVALHKTTESLISEWRRSTAASTVVAILPDSAASILCSEANHGIAAGLTREKHVFLWSASRKVVLWEAGAPVKWIVWSGYSPDHRWLAVGSTDRGWLFDLEAGNPEPWSIPLPPARFSLNAVEMAFSPNGRWLAVGFSTNAEEPCPILIFALSPQGPMNTLKPFRQITGHTDGVRALMFSPDSSLLASAGEEGYCLLWRTKDWAKIGDPLQHQGQVSYLRFAPDGSQLITGSRSRLDTTDTLRIWNVLDGTAASPSYRVDEGITRISYAPWLQSWIWADLPASAGTQKDVHLFSPATQPQDAKWLMGLAETLSGRQLTKSQLELAISPDELVERFSQLPAPPGRGPTAATKSGTAP